MEEVKEMQHKEKENMGSVTKTDEKISSESTGEVTNVVSDSGAAVKPSEEPKARFNRMKLFNKVMQKSLEKFIEHASFNRFASTFRQVYTKNPQRMESIYKQFIEDVKKAIQEDIDRLIEEGRLEVKLNELDKLERAAKNKTEPAWRPSGVPEEDLCSFLIPYYQKQEKYMQRELKKIQDENAALAQKVQAGRENIARTENHISNVVDEWKASAAKFEKLSSALCSADVFGV
ncbi:polyamine-modulated factor 1 [Cynoglossus semilaevis]|uniref:polyamine-modulated factor 1 n=1 Tax=Cynoglossus semilaevis TaxID=244447 RepID=UPI0004952586|nr:polyamine-modulated factor 1-like [Cynoglossus semilaevis]